MIALHRDRARAALPSLLVALAVALSACGHAAAALPPSAPSTLLGKRITYTLVSSDEGAPTPVPSAGRVTVVDYWAPTCVPCQKTLPALVARRGELSSAGAELVLVVVLGSAESTADAQRTLVEWGVAGEGFLVDRDEVAARQADVRALPATQVFDAHGALRWVAPEGAPAGDVVHAARAVAEKP